MKYKLLLIALIFSVGGYGQKIKILGEPQGNISIGYTAMNNYPDAPPPPTEFTNAPAIVETGTCVYLNRNDKIQIAKQATRTTYTEYMEDGPLLIASQEITYKTKYGINIPEDAVILFKIKPKK